MITQQKQTPVERPSAGEIAAALQVVAAAVRTDEIDEITGLLKSHIVLLSAAAELLPLEDLRALIAHRQDLKICIDGEFARKHRTCRKRYDVSA